GARIVSPSRRSGQRCAGGAIACVRRARGASRAARCVHSRARMPSPSQRWGAAHEEMAEARLVREGYRIVERNWRGGGGEVDRIAWSGEVLCFVEVRARSTASFGSPAETVDHTKQRKVV